MDNGYYIWSFQGKLLQRHALDQFCSLLWRPRPPTLLTEADIKVRYWWWIRLCCLLPGKPASLSSCEGSLLSLCHFLCLDWWLWIKTSFSYWYIFLFVKSSLMPRTSQPGICSGGTQWFLNPLARGNFAEKRNLKLVEPVFGHCLVIKTTKPFTGRTLRGLLILMQNISVRGSGMRRKGDTAVLTFSFRFLSSPPLFFGFSCLNGANWLN